MGLGNHFTDLFAWWRWELGLLPIWRRERERPDVLVHIRRAGMFIGRPDCEDGELVPVDDPDQLGEAVRREFGQGRLSRPKAGLVVESGRYLARSLSPMRLPRSHQTAMARLDLQTATPFKADDVYAVAPEYDATDPTTSYYVLKKDHLASAIAGLAANGVPLIDVAISADGKYVRPDRRSVRQLLQPKLRDRVLKRSAMAAATLAALALITTYGVVHMRYADALRELDGSLAIAQRQVSQLRVMIDARNRKVAQVMAARGSKRTSVPFASVLEEMARAIPDTTWLTEVELRGSEVTFSGFSTSAASLIPLLDASPLFASPTFRDPVVRVPNQAGERFTIGMDIEAPNG